ncbi:MAG: Ig domain-containing protein [Gaiella sp.]
MRSKAALVIAALTAALFASAASALDINQEVDIPDGEVGTPFSFEFESEEGCVPYRYSYSSGTVPPGLTITTDGFLKGTPTAPGNFEFYAAVDDSLTCRSDQSQGQFFMEVLPDLFIENASLPNARPGVPYEVVLTPANYADGVRVVWAIKQGSLPLGLTLTHGDKFAKISGTPTGVDKKDFVLRVEEPFRRWGEKTFSLTVASPMVVQKPAKPRGAKVGKAFRLQLSQTGGTSPVTWALLEGKLPNGLALDAGSGLVSGTPKASGRFRLVFEVTDGAGSKATVPVRLSISR